MYKYNYYVPAIKMNIFVRDNREDNLDKNIPGIIRDVICLRAGFDNDIPFCEGDSHDLTIYGTLVRAISKLIEPACKDSMKEAIKIASEAKLLSIEKYIWSGPLDYEIKTLATYAES